MKKGMVLTLDAVISMMFMIIIFIAISAQWYTNIPSTTESFLNLHFISEDAMDLMSKTGILDDIGQEWVLGNQTIADQTGALYFDRIIPYNMGYRLTYGGSTITENLRVLESRAHAATHSVKLMVILNSTAVPETIYGRDKMKLEVWM